MTFQWTAKLVTEALGLPPATWDHAYTGLSTDTRALKEGELFVALKGERFDAHDFLGDARLAGVGGVVVHHGTPRWPGFDWFEVPDTLEALGRLARLRRDRFAGRVIALTGTVGKTSTKELLAAALAPLGPVHRSAKNLNNLVGVPLTVLAAPDEAKAMVVECGASLVGEIPRMQQIVRPDVAIVTTVDAGHLEGFGSIEAVMEEKTSLLRGAATAVVGAKPPALAARARQLAKLVIVAGEGGDWQAENVTLGGDGRATFSVEGTRVTLPVPGRHMVDNALIALAAADAAGVSLKDAAAAMGGATLPGGRSEISEIHGVTVINDSYNANPASVRAALDLLAAVRGTRRSIAVVGTMRELGAESARLHREVAEAVLAIEPDLIVAIGEFADAFAALGGAVPAGRLITGATPHDVADALKDRLEEGDVLLLKASRGVALERLLPLLWPDVAAAGGH
jgi:UDP-N-acetylmuramoyl-tripeptide--D-alanyl-D-alanine ligase